MSEFVDTIAHRLNPNRLFGRLEIRLKLAIAFLVLSITPLSIVGWYALEQLFAALRTAVASEQERHLAQLQGQVDTLLRGVGEDLTFVAKSNAMLRLRAVGDASARERLVTTLADLLAAKRYYYRLRLLASSGEEVVHVVRVAGGSRVVRDGDWRRSGYRYYRTLLQRAGGDGVRFVPVELRDRSSDADAPMRLVSAFSFVAPVQGPPGGEPLLLVADVYAGEVLRLLERDAEVRSGEATIMLVGPTGHYLYHSAKKTDWNTLLATQSSQTLAEDFPADVAARVLTGEPGILDAPGWVLAHAPLFGRAMPGTGPYVLVSAVRREVALEPVHRVRRVVFLVGALTLLVAGLLAFVAAHQFTSPIRELRRGAARLAAGDFDARVRVDTNDELEDLADSFWAMARALERREHKIVQQSQELERYARELESMVEERTRELRESQRALVHQEKMVAAGQLAAGVAHELGSPLGAILLHAGMALEELDDAPSAAEVDRSALRESLTTVIAQAERTRAIVRNLLDFSRPSAQERRPLALDELVRRTAELMAHDLHRRGVELELALEPVTIIADRNEIEQVLVNLLRNAADAMVAGGRIRVGTARRERAGDAAQACLRVSDRGAGIPAEAVDRVFEPFFTTKPPGVGTGLGLWVCYNIVTDHGGSIEVESTGPEGTTFRVCLPCAQEDRA